MATGQLMGRNMHFKLTCKNIRLATLILALGIGTSLILGCASSPAPADSSPIPAVSTPAWPANAIPVARYGRYTLVELVPSSAQQDLMQQVIDVTIPAAMTNSVGEALRYVLLRSGYQLCDDRDETRAFDTLPLPAAHVRLGPLILRDALQLLAGSAWQLEVDSAARRVCFARRNDSNTKEHNP